MYVFIFLIFILETAYFEKRRNRLPILNENHIEIEIQNPNSRNSLEVSKSFGDTWPNRKSLRTNWTMLKNR